jgi:hypothetical protein
MMIAQTTGWLEDASATLATTARSINESGSSFAVADIANISGILVQALRNSCVSQFIAEVESLRTLPAGWDGYESDPPNALALGACTEALLLIQSMPTSVMPSAEGGIAIRWDGNLKHAYIEFRNDGTAISAFYGTKGEATIAEFVPSAEETSVMLKRIESFYTV